MIHMEIPSGQYTTINLINYMDQAENNPLIYLSYDQNNYRD